MKMRLLTALLVSPCIALAQAPSPQSIRLLKQALNEDYGVAVANGKAAFSWGVRRYDFDVQAVQIAGEYRSSSSDASLKYDGRWIKINGPVDRIDVDKAGRPFVDLGVVSDSSADIRATFEDSSSFLNGQAGPMICKVTGTLHEKPVLTECRYQYLIGADRVIPPFIDGPMNDWLSGGQRPWFAPTQAQQKALSAMATALDQIASAPECRAGLASEACQSKFLQTIQHDHDVTK